MANFHVTQCIFRKVGTYVFIHKSGVSATFWPEFDKKRIIERII